MKKTTIIGISRGCQFSPNHIDNDAAIFTLVAEKLKEMGYAEPDCEVPLTVAELVDMGICPTCYDRSHNGALYGDCSEQTLYENDLFICLLIGYPTAYVISKAPANLWKLTVTG